SIAVCAAARCPLLPYTALFRSGAAAADRYEGGAEAHRHVPGELPRGGAVPRRAAGAGARAGVRRDAARAAALRAADREPEPGRRSEEHTSELQSRENLVCRLLL